MSEGEFVPKREFRFNVRSDSTVIVAINIGDCYIRTLAMANLLYAELVESLGFEHAVVEEPKVVTLGGDRRKGMMSVEMIIRPEPSTQEVKVALEKKGFLRGLWPSIS